MKILVTGANGYLGQGIVRQLLDDGIEVIAADFSTENIDKRAKSISCDLFSVQDPFDYFSKPDVLLHLAWKNGFVHNADSHIVELPLHYRFIKEMVSGGIVRLCVMGTMHEVGFYEGSINENTPTNPKSMYGIAKNALRNAAGLLCEESNVVFQWLRGFYIVGNTKFGNSIFSKITAAEEKGDKLFPFTMGINQWDFIDYDDFCIQVGAAVEQREINGIINICSGRPEKLSERVERFISENNYKIKLDYGKFPDRPYDSKAVWGDDKKIKQILEERLQKTKE